MMGFLDAVASAGPYANNLGLYIYIHITINNYKNTKYLLITITLYTFHYKFYSFSSSHKYDLTSVAVRKYRKQRNSEPVWVQKRAQPTEFSTFLLN